jgi:hypothetical protein
MAGEFVEGTPGKDCTEMAGGWGQASTSYDWIWKGNIDRNNYPEEACLPWYHRNFQVDDIQVNNNVTVANQVTAATFQGNINVQSWKGFDIKHPNKKNHRLRHICLEGPEAGVYFRGRLTGKNVIELPDYWKGLIDPETITVTLTQIRTSQDLVVDVIEWGSRIKIKSGNGTDIDCFYLVQASRIDGEPLIVEYEGETPAEYPGSKDQFSISGFDY